MYPNLYLNLFSYIFLFSAWLDVFGPSIYVWLPGLSAGRACKCSHKFGQLCGMVYWAENRGFILQYSRYQQEDQIYVMCSQKRKANCAKQDARENIKENLFICVASSQIIDLFVTPFFHVNTINITHEQGCNTRFFLKESFFRLLSEEKPATVV